MKTKRIIFPIPEQYFPIKGVLFTGRQDKLKSLSKSEWQQQDRWWLEGVWGRRLECIIMHRTAGSRDWEGCWASALSEFSQQYRSVCPETSALNHWQQSWEPWEETLHCPTDSTHTFALQKCQTDWDTSHTLKHKHTVVTVLSSRHSLSCVSGLYSCCPPCDWCLASLALTNTDWSHTLNDFGPNLFKDSSRVCSCQISQLRVQLDQKLRSSVNRVKRQREKQDEQLTSPPPLQQEQDRAGRYLQFQLVSHLHRETKTLCSRYFMSPTTVPTF